MVAPTVLFDRLTDKSEFSETVARVQQAVQGVIGFVVGEQGGEPLIHHQRFQGKLQMTQIRQGGKTVAGAAAGQSPLGLPYGVVCFYGPQTDTQLLGFWPAVKLGGDQFFFHLITPQ